MIVQGFPIICGEVLTGVDRLGDYLKSPASPLPDDRRSSGLPGASPLTPNTRFAARHDGHESRLPVQIDLQPSGKYARGRRAWRRLGAGPERSEARPRGRREQSAGVLDDLHRSTRENKPYTHAFSQNWSLTAKLCTYLTICSFTFLANVNSSNFTVATQAIIKEFQVNQTQAGQLVCFNVFLFGVGNIFWVPLMRVIGKRPVYLLAMLMLCMMNVWSSQATSYGELLASRIVSGFAAAAADATVPAVVADMVAAKDRGHYMMFFHLAMTAGLFLGPLINAYLVQEQDWRWMCYFLAIAVGVVFLVAIFTIRETSYLKRHQAEPNHRRSQWQWMSLTVGFNREASFIQTLLDILANATYPPLIWCSLTIGISVGW